MTPETLIQIQNIIEKFGIRVTRAAACPGSERRGSLAASHTCRLVFLLDPQTCYKLKSRHPAAFFLHRLRYRSCIGFDFE